MTSLAIVSPKGGVGKTTLCLNLALAFAQRGRRVLLMDTDPQGAIGLSLVGRPKDARGLAECLDDDTPLADLVLETRVRDLHVLTAGHPPVERLAEWAHRLADGATLARLLREAEAAYDLVLIDTPAGLMGPTYGVLWNVSHVLLPLQTEPLAIRAVPLLMEALAALRQQGRPVALAAIVLTMTSFREEISLTVSQEAWRLFPPELMLEAYVPRDSTFLAASAHGVPVSLLRKRPPPVAAMFDHLVAELEPRLGLSHAKGDDEATPLVD